MVDRQWQPIETAPKDGTDILTFRIDGDCHHVPVYQVLRWHAVPDGSSDWDPLIDGEWLDWGGDSYSDGGLLTYWMPLPPIPDGVILDPVPTIDDMPYAPNRSR